MWDGRANQVRVRFKENTATTYMLLLEGSRVGQEYGLDRDYYVVIDHRGIVRYRTPDGGSLGSRFDEASIRAAIVMALDELALEAAEAAEAAEEEQGEITAVLGEQVVPGTFAWIMNYPNPFNASTAIHFNLARAIPVTLEVYDVQGRLVRRLWVGHLAAGEHWMRWDGRNEMGLAVATGIYLGRLEAGAETQFQKMLLLR